MTQKIPFHPNKESLSDFLEELDESVERMFRDNAEHMIDSSPYEPFPSLLKRSLNLACLEKVTYDQILAHLEKKLELSGLENDSELSKPTITAVTPNEKQQNTD